MIYKFWRQVMTGMMPWVMHWVMLGEDWDCLGVPACLGALAILNCFVLINFKILFIQCWFGMKLFNMDAHIIILMIYKFWTHAPRSTCLSRCPCYFKSLHSH